MFHTNSKTSDIETKTLESRSAQQSYYQMQDYIIFLNRTKLFNVNLYFNQLVQWKHLRCSCSLIVSLMTVFLTHYVRLRNHASQMLTLLSDFQRISGQPIETFLTEEPVTLSQQLKAERGLIREESPKVMLFPLIFSKDYFKIPAYQTHNMLEIDFTRKTQIVLLISLLL